MRFSLKNYKLFFWGAYVYKKVNCFQKCNRFFLTTLIFFTIIYVKSYPWRITIQYIHRNTNKIAKLTPIETNVTKIY